ncbi:31-O-demethyl-FK506 methyltransferase [Streptomyces rapamycinicus NRRL 5491]|uniref:31-O-demethyl-FK506 methyltransferase n=2 Tax=Streptomyces rapamycinicus TaxID=1226757 RepID=A0A0A0NSZ3_STRRN|nr:FkbM family methyltransferase [Streptomyces rapamycinicus]AGP59508.1 31-O-demethyl-FK506 methyltransferase [Streptomyces rapamycinicus NRRL 5491]MBB4789357.1 FkbM family methyltransferase [Streptomyces rapamycinicus]RLV77303.1 31-O-demethyl-FK506 methyltransferase [Streptomyces rapamycinicus NRRL 5491]BCH36739.1 methyltransferase [Streptomyces rapamycinicus NRRL 5491]
MSASVQTIKLPNGKTVAHVNPGEAQFLYQEIFAERCYLRRGLELRAGDVVFDVGANIGMFSLFAHLECPDVTVHAFEPAPVPYAALRANAERYGIAGRFEQCAVSDVAGRGKMTFYTDTTMMSGFHPDPATRAELLRRLAINGGYSAEAADRMLAELPDTSQVIETSVVRLSDVIAERGITSIGLLKIDVEKNERHVMAGIDAADWPRIRQVVTEVHDIDGRLDEVLTLLRGQGFTVLSEQEPLFAGTDIYQVVARRGDA